MEPASYWEARIVQARAAQAALNADTDNRIKEWERRAEEARRTVQNREALADKILDMPPHTILTWERVYGPQSVRRNVYTFVAMKMKRNRWSIVSGNHKNVVDHRAFMDEYIAFAEYNTLTKALYFERI